MTLNLLGKMGFGALGGFEYVAIHAGASRDPARGSAPSPCRRRSTRPSGDGRSPA
jgi:hypothetical protein